MVRTGPSRRPGRPQDPDLEARTYRAALEVYGAGGWAGFTINHVAAKAKVGKAAIYSRWASKEELVVDATMSIDVGRAVPDTGSLREDLIETVTAELADYLSPVGVVKLRAQVEAKIYPELFGRAMDRIRAYRLQGGRSVIAAAVGRGELSPDLDGTLLLDAIGGMTINHFLATPAGRLAHLGDHAREFAERVVDFALRAAGAEGPAPSPDRGAADARRQPGLS